jgi:hypothetical protein
MESKTGGATINFEAGTGNGARCGCQDEAAEQLDRKDTLQYTTVAKQINTEQISIASAAG